MSMINDSIDTLSSSFNEGVGSPGPTWSAQEISENFRALSRREAEVCSLLARRLKTSEIAACLFVSPRTIEKHVESIFSKLDVRSRDQLRWRLGVRLPPAR